MLRSIKCLKLLRLSTAGFLVGLCSAPTVSADQIPESREPIVLALNEWTGQHITTYVAGEILERMGYTVEYVAAGYVPQFNGLMDGTLTATLEIWESSIGEAPAKAVATGNVEDLGSVGLTPIEGWFYPAYVAEACPGLPDWQALDACAEQFATAATFPQGRLVDYPAEWETKNDVRVKALDMKFDVVPSGSEGALVSELKAAVAKQQPFVMMFWSPHWVHNVYPGDWVQFPDYEPACFEDPAWGQNPDEVRDCGFANNWINKFAWVGMKDKWPAAHQVLQAYQLQNAEQEEMMKAIDVDGNDVQDVAKAWVEANEAIWRTWTESAVTN